MKIIKFFKVKSNICTVEFFYDEDNNVYVSVNKSKLRYYGKIVKDTTKSKEAIKIGDYIVDISNKSIKRSIKYPEINKNRKI